MLASPARPRTSTTPVRTFRPEVQALRAIAVSLVVVYHLWPASLPGGYVGVDVFFVVSGFLITSHLARELAADGRVDLPRFYARRARRLLPAALLVLLVTVTVAWLVLPPAEARGTGQQALASAFFVQNWFLAGQAVDYSALAEQASAVQHYWSLSVEEQFYLLWPALLLLLVVLRPRRGPGQSPLLLPGVLLVAGASFTYSVLATASDQSAAYFVTPTRVWELAAGGVLALVLDARAGRTRRRGGPGPVVRSVAVLSRWGGLALVVGAAWALDDTSAFPGYLALAPVLGTVAVIAAGDVGRDPVLWVGARRPVQFLGGISYSLYLWHWPCIVLAPFVLGRPSGPWDQAGIVVLSVALAWLTKTLVEDSALRLTWPVRRPWAGLAAAATAMSVLVGVVVVQGRALDEQEQQAEVAVAAVEETDCFGAGALVPGRSCDDPFGPALSLVQTARDEPWFSDRSCSQVGSPDSLLFSVCRFGDGPPTRRVAVVGDSHAEHWRGAIHRIADREGWELVEVFRGGCPAVAVDVLQFQGAPMDTQGCASWFEEATELLASDPPDDVITSAYGSAYTFDTDARSSREVGAAGFQAAWTRWANLGIQVHVIRDVPTLGDEQASCVAVHEDDPRECSVDRAEALPEDPAVLASERVGPAVASTVDLSDQFCDAVSCYAVIGGVQVYWDENHVSAQYSRTLDRVLEERLGIG